MFSHRYRTGLGSLSALACALSFAGSIVGCGDGRSSGRTAAPDRWTATETSVDHAKLRASEAKRSIEAAAGGGAVDADRERALLLAASTAEAVPAALRAAKESGWRARTLSAAVDHARREGSPAADLA